MDIFICIGWVKLMINERDIYIYIYIYEYFYIYVHGINMYSRKKNYANLIVVDIHSEKKGRGKKQNHIK